MKHFILLVLLSVGLATTGLGQASDYAQIEQTVNYYLEGGTNNDFATLEKAFHKDARMTFVTDDGYKEVNAVNFFRERMKPGPASDRITRVVSIEQNGLCASARLEILYETHTFHDYMTLLKIEGQWKIVNKSFYREVK